MSTKPGFKQPRNRKKNIYRHDRHKHRGPRQKRTNKAQLELPSWLPIPAPHVVRRASALSIQEQMEAVLVWMRVGYTAMQAASMVRPLDQDQSLAARKRWLWKLRRKSPLFSERVAAYDRIARDITPSLQSNPKRQLWNRVREKERGILESDLYSRKQRQRAMEEMVTIKQKEAFLRIYRETGDRNAALDKLKLRTRDVIETLEQDEKFKADFTEEQQRHLWGVEDAEMRRARDEGAAARFMMTRMEKKKVPVEKKKNAKAAPSWASEEGLKSAEAWARGEVGFAAEPPVSEDEN